MGGRMENSGCNSTNGEFGTAPVNEDFDTKTIVIPYIQTEHYV